MPRKKENGFPPIDLVDLKTEVVKAHANQIRSIVQKMNEGRPCTVYEQKIIREVIDGNDSEDGLGVGRFYTMQDVADHYGVKKQTVLCHLRKGNIKRNPDGTFDKAITDAYWIEKLGRKFRPISANAPEAPPGEPVQESTVDREILDAKLRKAKAEAQIKEIMAEQLRGGVAPIDEVFRGWCARHRLVRDTLLSWVDRLPALLVGLDQIGIKKSLKKEVYALLDGFAKDGRYTPRV